jgi:DNA invertase Pin-like site-specific DNA recombinase
MGKKISEDIINQIPALYKELGTKKAVAEKLGISSSTVSKYINLYEAAPQSAPPATKR